MELLRSVPGVDRQERHFANGVIGGLHALAPGTALRQFADDEFLKQISDRSRTYTDHCVLDSESDAIAIFGCVIDIGDSAGGQAPDKAGVICLPVAIVTFANHRLGESV